MVFMHSSSVLGLSRWLHLRRSNVLATSVAACADGPASYNALMQHCVITAVGERGQLTQAGRRGALGWAMNATVRRLTRLDLTLEDVAHPGLELELLLGDSLDEGSVDCAGEDERSVAAQNRGNDRTRRSGASSNDGGSSALATIDRRLT